MSNLENRISKFIIHYSTFDILKKYVLFRAENVVCLTAPKEQLLSSEVFSVEIPVMNGFNKIDHTIHEHLLIIPHRQVASISTV